MKITAAVFGMIATALLTVSAHADCNKLVENAAWARASRDLRNNDISIGITDVFAGNSIEKSEVQILVSVGDPESPPTVVADYVVLVRTHDGNDVSGAELSQSCTLLKIVRIN